MRARSKKRAAQERTYRRLRDAFLTARPRCEMRLECCTTWATEVHHMRGRDGDRLLVVDWWMAGCSACHRWVTEHPAEAYEKGLSLHRNGVLS